MIIRRAAAPRLVSGIFAIVGVVLLGIGGWLGNRQYTIITTWPAVDAEVTRSRVTSGRDSKGTAMYGAEIEFRYTVAGKERVTPSSVGYTTSSYLDMKHKVDRYAPGTRHPVRYNPTDPDDIRFNAGYNFGFFLLPIVLGGMGMVFASLGIAGLFTSRPGRVVKCPACGQPVEKGQNFCPHCAAALPVNGL